jgi:hypothetical protein
MGKEKKKIDEKKLIIILAPLVLLFMIYILYTAFKGNDKENNNTKDSVKTSALVIPDVKADTTPKTKSNIYDEMDSKEKSKEEIEKQKSSADFFNMNDAKPQAVTPPPAEIQKQPVPVAAPTPVVKKKVVSSNNVHHVKTNTTTQNTNTTNRNQNNSQPSAPVPSQTDNNYSFGVYKAKGGSSSTTSNNNAENGYIQALLDKSMKIRQGSEVIFIMQQNTTINGTYFEKMSIMYGIAKFAGNRVDIIINMIQDRKGVKHPVTLYGFNENYQKGIFYTDRVEATANQAKQQVAGAATNAVLGSTTAGQVAGTASNLLNRDNQEINVSGGYKMFFKQ